jgi:YbbR domain-containing protein
MMDRILENDTALKILSLLVAIAIWVQVNSGVPAVRDRRLGPVPVTWIGAQNHYTVLGMHPGSVVIDIKGPPSAVDQTTPPSAWVDLARISRPGTYSLPVSASVPQGTSLVSVSPADVTVTVDSLVSRKLPVHAVAEGQLPSGYGIVAMTPASSSASVFGPSTAVDAVKRIVARVSVQGQTANLEAQVALVPVDAAGHTVSKVTVTPDIVNVAVEVSPEKTVPVVVTYHGTPAAGYVVTAIDVAPGRVTLYGSASLLAGITQVDTVPVAIAGRTSSVTRRVRLALPTGVTAALTTVQVTMHIGP